MSEGALATRSSGSTNSTALHVAHNVGERQALQLTANRFGLASPVGIASNSFGRAPIRAAAEVQR